MVTMAVAKLLMVRLDNEWERESEIRERYGSWGGFTYRDFIFENTLIGM